MPESPDRGASYSRLIWPEITRAFSLSTATDYHPTKTGLLIAQYQDRLKSHGQTDPGPIRPLS